ncbi:hypothetical protein V8D89_003284 [Ganoderma adspersum]
MYKKTSVIPLQDMMVDFSGHAMIEFSSERDMYDYIIKSLNGFGEFSRNGMTFTCDQSDSDQQDIVCGMYGSGSVLQEEYTAEPRCMIWTLIELLITCKLDSVIEIEDPFDEPSKNEVAVCKRREVLDEILSHVELVFKYQQRQFVFMVLFLGKHARVIRFDRSGIIASEKIDYKKDGAQLNEFIVRYACLDAMHRGHVPSAVRISPTDVLGKQLKQHGADAAERDPEDHVQKLFNRSLDEKWSWWKLCVRDGESEVERWFAVGKSHFCAGGVGGRGTRGYVAVPLDDNGEEIDLKAKFVYLKDAWRVNHEGMEKEGTILKALNAAKVPHIPTLLYHGDLDQSTKSYDMWLEYHEGKTREACPLKSHQHYRLVVAEVGKPLSEFENAFQLVWALYCCITAHERACAAGYIHRDISAGNILLYRDAAGRWAGLLNDWELSSQFGDGGTQGGGQQLGRMGTWQFMSVHVLLARTKLVKIPDELESFFHVLVYLAVRFLPHNLGDDLVGNFLHDYFDDYTDGDDGSLCGPVKYNSIKRGVIDLTTITGTVAVTNKSQKGKPLVFFMPQSTPFDNRKDATTRDVHPINQLTSELLEAFQAFYARDDVAEAKMGALDDPFSVPPEVRDAIAAFKKSGAWAGDRTATPGTRNASGSTAASALAAKVETHAAMRRIMLNYLGSAPWPKLDKGSTAVGSTILESTIPTRSKRGAEDGGGSRKFKRVRNRAA